MKLLTHFNNQQSTIHDTFHVGEHCLKQPNNNVVFSLHLYTCCLWLSSMSEWMCVVRLRCLLHCFCVSSIRNRPLLWHDICRDGRESNKSSMILAQSTSSYISLCLIWMRSLCAYITMCIRAAANRNPRRQPIWIGWHHVTVGPTVDRSMQCTLNQAMAVERSQSGTEKTSQKRPKLIGIVRRSCWKNSERTFSSSKSQPGGCSSHHLEQNMKKSYITLCFTKWMTEETRKAGGLGMNHLAPSDSIWTHPSASETWYCPRLDSCAVGVRSLSENNKTIMVCWACACTLAVYGSGGVDVLWHMKLSMPVLSSIPLSDQIVLDWRIHYRVANNMGIDAGIC